MNKLKQIHKLIKKLVEMSFKDGKLIESQIVKSIKVLKALPRSQAIEALSRYLKELKMKEREFTMLLETAVPVAPDVVKRARRIVERKHKITKVIVNVDPSIIGGFRLRIGDQVWDESILAKLKSVKEEILIGRSN